MQKISLCMMVKNEERHLAACLASVRGAVDEMVVVDTGSTDSTVRIAEEAGARVLHHPWNDDFSEPRNVGVRAATGDWILLLDADERLVGDAHLALRDAVEDSTLDCGLLQLHNASSSESTLEDVLSGAARLGEPVLLPRLLRRVDGLAFEGVVHESPTSWLRRRIPRVRPVRAAVVHYGAVPSLRREKGKYDRNRSLLEARCASAPDDVAAHAFLTHEYLTVGRTEEARQTAEKGWEALARAMATPEDAPPVVAMAVLRNQILLNAGDVEGATQTMVQALSWGKDHPNLHFFLARTRAFAALQTEDPDQRARLLTQAVEGYRRTLAMANLVFAEEVWVGITRGVGRSALGTALLLLNQPEEALAAFDDALAIEPMLEEAICGKAETLLHLGTSAAALRCLEAVLGQATRPDAWALAAAAAAIEGDAATAAHLAERAVQAQGSGWFAPHRGDYLRHVLHELEEATIATRSSASAPASTPPTRPQPSPRPSAQVAAPAPAPVEPTAPAPATATRPKPVIVCGAPFSGSTLLRSLLAAHPRLQATPPLPWLGEFLRLQDLWSRSWLPGLRSSGLTDQAMDAAGAAYLHTLLGVGTAPGRRPILAHAEALQHLDLLARWFSEARFVHVVRDGRAVTASLLRASRQGAGGQAAGASALTATEAASRWSEAVQRGRWQAALNAGRVLEVRYEELVQRPEAELRRVLLFLGEPWDVAVVPRVQAGPRREGDGGPAPAPLHASSVDRWRAELDEADVAQVQAAAGRMLETLGYR